MKIIQSKCQCGEPISIETGLKNVCRTDGKRPFYPGSDLGSTQFRCRKCHGWLGDTCPDASFSTPKKSTQKGDRAPWKDQFYSQQIW